MYKENVVDDDRKVISLMKIRAAGVCLLIILFLVDIAY